MTKTKNLWVYASKSGEGYTYSLPPHSEDLLRQTYPNIALHDRLLLTQNIAHDFATVHQRIAPQLLSLLTELSTSELMALGPWEFRDPQDNSLLFAWNADLTESTSQKLRGTPQTIAPNPKRRSTQRKAAS
jgi:hypothetical protein